MKILILSSAFERPYCNARLRFQCDYLIRKGHYVEVYTEPWDTLNFKHKYPIYEIGEKNSNYLKWITLSIYSLFTNYKERKFAYQVLWNSRKTNFDLIYCSTNSCFPLGAATLLSKLKGLPLHVDLWDIEELKPNYIRHKWWHPIKFMRQQLYMNRRNSALKQAQFITTISPKHVELVRPLNSNVELMYNGFDSRRFYFQPTRTDVFRINFFGFAYSSQRIDMILRIMEKFQGELPKAQWTFYSTDLSYNHIKRSGPNICGILPEEVLPDTIRKSSLVLLFNDTEDNGLNYEQFYQALGTEKPVLFTNVSSGVVPDMIQMTNLGIATNNINESMNYIRELYHQWEQDGYTHREVKGKEAFDIEHQGERLEQIFANIQRSLK